MVLASTSARLGPLSMSAALRKIWALSWTGFRSHSFLAAKAALMALLMSSCRREGERQQGGTHYLSITRLEGTASGHPSPHTDHSSHLPVTTPNLQLLVSLCSGTPGTWKANTWPRSLPACGLSSHLCFIPTSEQRSQHASCREIKAR